MAERSHSLSSIFWSVVIPLWGFYSTLRIPRKREFWWTLLVERCLVTVLLSSEASPFIRAAFWGFLYVCGLNQASDLREDVLYFSSWIVIGCDVELGGVDLGGVYQSKYFNFFPQALCLFAGALNRTTQTLQVFTRTRINLSYDPYGPAHACS